MSHKKWLKLNELLIKIQQNEDTFKRAKILGKLIGLLVDIVYYFVAKKGGK